MPAFSGAHCCTQGCDSTEVLSKGLMPGPCRFLVLKREKHADDDRIMAGPEHTYDEPSKIVLRCACGAALCLWGVVLLRIGDADAAIKALLMPGRVQVCDEEADTVLGCAQINERSSVLRCSLGTTLARMGDAGGAIKGLRAAIRADQANPLARFELAGVLLGQERFQEALQELMYLRVSSVAPRCFSGC